MVRPLFTLDNTRSSWLIVSYTCVIIVNILYLFSTRVNLTLFEDYLPTITLQNYLYTLQFISNTLFDHFSRVLEIDFFCVSQCLFYG